MPGHTKALAQCPLLKSLQLLEGQGQLEMRGMTMEGCHRITAWGKAQVPEQGVKQLPH